MLRHRRGWRQADLASRAGVSAGLVGLLERGRADRLTVRAVRGICRTMDLAIAWNAGQRGFELMRLRDADHAALGARTAELLQGAGWETAAEVSFNHYGDRGRIDLIAFHARTGDHSGLRDEGDDRGHPGAAGHPGREVPQRATRCGAASMDRTSGHPVPGRRRRLGQSAADRDACTPLQRLPAPRAQRPRLAQTATRAGTCRHAPLR